MRKCPATFNISKTKRLSLHHTRSEIVFSSVTIFLFTLEGTLKLRWFSNSFQILNGIHIYDPLLKNLKKNPVLYTASLSTSHHMQFLNFTKVIILLIPLTSGEDLATAQISKMLCSPIALGVS